MSVTFPTYRGKMKYHCISCQESFDANQLYYTCPSCNGILLLKDTNFHELKKTRAEDWRKIFDTRAASKNSALRGIFRFYELMAPILEEEDIIYLGEGNTPIIESSKELINETYIKSAFKNDGQNPSASFKDRGMACAFSYLQHIIRTQNISELLAICASTGDTSAAAALYGAYIGKKIKQVVILPKGKVTPQQLAQPLGNGATVIEVPGVFDDCMKIVEHLADNYHVALLNSKNAWRILGQESYAFEIAQWYDWDLKDKAIFVPVGNAGNITAIMSGFLKLHELNIITDLPQIFGVQSHHADPVYRYYSTEKSKRKFEPVTVQASVAQAAMIGNPVSFPRVQYFAEKFIEIAGENSFQIMQVTEQDIIDSMLKANSHGHIACTQGGESFAGMLEAKKQGLISEHTHCILDSTAHHLKFIGFQEDYYNDALGEFGIIAKKELQNHPMSILSEKEKNETALSEYITKAAKEIINKLSLQKK